MPHDLRSIEVFTDDGWLCTAYPQDQLTREESDAVIGARREAAREMGRRKAAAPAAKAKAKGRAPKAKKAAAASRRRPAGRAGARASRARAPKARTRRGRR